MNWRERRRREQGKLRGPDIKRPTQREVESNLKKEQELYVRGYERFKSHEVFTVPSGGTKT